jgi:hypothetical protein
MGLFCQPWVEKNSCRVDQSLVNVGLFDQSAIVFDILDV